ASAQSNTVGMNDTNVRSEDTNRKDMRHSDSFDLMIERKPTGRINPTDFGGAVERAYRPEWKQHWWDQDWQTNDHDRQMNNDDNSRKDAARPSDPFARTIAMGRINPTAFGGAIERTYRADWQRDWWDRDWDNTRPSDTRPSGQSDTIHMSGPAGHNNPTE